MLVIVKRQGVCLSMATILRFWRILDDKNE